MFETGSVGLVETQLLFLRLSIFTSLLMVKTFTRNTRSIERHCDAILLYSRFDAKWDQIFWHNLVRNVAKCWPMLMRNGAIRFGLILARNAIRGKLGKRCQFWARNSKAMFNLNTSTRRKAIYTQMILTLGLNGLVKPQMAAYVLKMAFYISKNISDFLSENFYFWS